MKKEGGSWLLGRKTRQRHSNNHRHLISSKFNCDVKDLFPEILRMSPTHCHYSESEINVNVVDHLFIDSLIWKEM